MAVGPAPFRTGSDDVMPVAVGVAVAVGMPVAVSVAVLELVAVTMAVELVAVSVRLVRSRIFKLGPGGLTERVDEEESGGPTTQLLVALLPCRHVVRLRGAHQCRHLVMLRQRVGLVSGDR